MIDGEPLGDEYLMVLDTIATADTPATVAVHAPRGSFRVLPGTGGGSTATAAARPERESRVGQLNPERACAGTHLRIEGGDRGRKPLRHSQIDRIRRPQRQIKSPDERGGGRDIR